MSQYIIITNVDAATGVPCTEAPMRTGPVFPTVKGLQVQFADESTWPVPCNPDGSYSRAPKCYGTCDDDADINLTGVIAVLTNAEYTAAKRAEFYARQPYASWLFDEATLTWSAPVPYPEDGLQYVWDESTISWKQYERLH